MTLYQLFEIELYGYVLPEHVGIIPQAESFEETEKQDDFEKWLNDEANYSLTEQEF